MMISKSFVLYVDKSVQSERAKEVLKDVGITVHYISVNDFEYLLGVSSPPLLMAKHGYFAGLQNIEWYANSVRSKYW